MRSRRYYARFILGIPLALYILFAAGMAFYQRSFIYIPFAGPETPEKAGLAHFGRHTLNTANGPVVYWESTDNTDRPTLLYFHGNGGGLHIFVPAMDYLEHHGFHVVAMEYRGFPSAPAHPTESDIERDGLALADAIHTARPTQPFFIWGYSLGSGVAVQVAAKHPPKALVLEAPFTALVDRAGEMFPFLPTRWLIRDRYLSRDAITYIHAPLFIMHGDHDRMIPIHHGHDLYIQANDPKIFKIYKGFGHLDLIKSPAYDDAAAFLHDNER